MRFHLLQINKVKERTVVERKEGFSLISEVGLLVREPIGTSRRNGKMRD